MSVRCPRCRGERLKLSRGVAGWCGLCLTAHSAWQRGQYRALRAAGLCVVCKRRSGEFAHCPEHRAEAAAWQRAYRLARSAMKNAPVRRSPPR